MIHGEVASKEFMEFLKDQAKVWQNSLLVF